MVRRFVATALAPMLALSLSAAGALAQQPPSSPLPLFPTPPPPSFREEPLPPIAPAPELPRFPDPAPPPAAAAAGPPPEASAAARVFCDQAVTVRVADREAIPERYRGFVGMWSDAAWTPLLCAALIVEDVAPDGTARIVYAFGPLGSGARGPSSPKAGGVLNGTGIIRDGELRFQNSDGSQFAFRPIYSDLDGRLTTPQGQRHQAIFKKTL